MLLACKGSLERLVYYKVSSKADGEDILGEVFLTAITKFETLKSKDNFKAWILTITRNKINDFYRNKAKMMELPLDEAISYETNFGRYRITTHEIVQETLGNLKDTEKQILYLYFFKQKPQIEIAKMLDIPVGTVKSRLHNAKLSFKEKYPYSNEMRGEIAMKKLPEFLPEYIITQSAIAPFPVKWEELLGMFIVPRLGEEIVWGIFDMPQRNRTEWGEMTVTGRAVIHGVEGVEIRGHRHNRYGQNFEDRDHYYVAQLTDTHCRYLAENYEKNGARHYFTFLDGDDFVKEWGFGNDNCGKETNAVAKGTIIRNSSIISSDDIDEALDVVGRYDVTIAGKTYDTICVMNLSSYYNNFVATEQYIDKNGRTVLWRRFNRDDWEIEHYKQKWSEKLPQNEQVTINGKTYVHWYDCITDYIL